MQPDLPRYEKAPTAGYWLGHAIAQGCLTRSLLLNVVRLAALWWSVPQAVLLLGGRGSFVSFGLGVAVLVGTFALRPRHAVVSSIAPEQWSKEERKLAHAVETAVATGQPIADALAAVSDTAPAIDYGTTPDGRPVCVAPALRHKHQLITGGSGTGKSKLIATQAAQDALMSGVLVVDPHEELVQDILCTAAHVIAERGMVLLWPDGPQRGIYPWNPLWTGPGRAAWQAADSVVGAVKRVWGLTDKNTYIIDVLKHTLWALAGAGWTLLEAQRFLTDKDFRAYVTEQANLPEVTMWVANFDALPKRDQVNLTQTTLVRVARLSGNPYIKQLVGSGVSDARYRTAYSAVHGKPPVAGQELGAAINAGQHVFAVVPKRVLGEDQYLVAGLVQSAMLDATFRRRPNDPTAPELAAYLDEAGAYATNDGLGKLLAQARKYKFSGTVSLQGLHQVEDELQDELKTNTAIKIALGTDHPDEALDRATSLFAFDPTAIKIDARTRTGEGRNRHDSGQFQTYSPHEQREFHAGRIVQLPMRHYLLKVRGEGDPIEVITPTYHARYELAEAVRLAGRRRVVRLAHPDDLAAELRWRWQWLDAQGYQAIPHPSAVPTSVPAWGNVEPAAADVPPAAACVAVPDEGHHATIHADDHTARPPHDAGATYHADEDWTQPAQEATTFGAADDH